MLSMAEYFDLKARHARNVAYWAGRSSLSKEESDAMPDDARITNDERSAIEVFEFCAAPPESYFLYIQKKPKHAGPGNVTPIGAESVATTWTGDRLGTAFLGQPFRDNFGGTRVPVTIRAVNGRTYHGTYYKSAGDYARVKLAKGKARANG